MTAAGAAAMDAAVTKVLEPFAADGDIELQIQGRITWGRPRPAS